MKTSKIILIAFLSVFCLSLLSFMITVDRKNDRKQFEFENIEEPLADVSVIKASKGVNVTLVSTDSNLIKYSHLKDSSCITPYEIIGDTLVLKPHKQNQENWHYDVNLSSNITSIINNGGDISINLNQDSLHVITNNEGRFQVYDKSIINYLKLYVTENSRSHFSNSKIKQLELVANNSKVDINNKIESVNLTAKNHANITLKLSNKLNVNCDSLSRYRIY